ncbi:DUF2567 domain-containing protein [Mycobacterium sp. HNNTM2301]|uniref:DUF2567 domain-containing protein n=1 Tax=Mycobacterium hainanense TaxID=3289775 RepID=UPI0035A7192C
MTEHAHTPPSAPSRALPRRATAIAGLAPVAAGVLLGALWVWIAPPIHAVVALTRAGERVHDYLGNESQHFFDAPCLMLGLLTVLAVLGAAVAWQWRARRGPGMVVALATGLATAAAVAAATGAALARIRYGALNFDAVPLPKGPSVAYVIQAPPVFFASDPLRVALTLLWPAAVAALVYAVLAAADARDDLGAMPPRDRSSDALRVGAGSAPEGPGS